jgi:hypothetical protein
MVSALIVFLGLNQHVKILISFRLITGLRAITSISKGNNMQLTNEDNYSLSIAVFLAADFYDHNRHPGKLHMSATGLLKPIRQTILGMRMESNNIVHDIKQDIPNRVGTAIHAGIERAWLHRYAEAMAALGYPANVIKKIRVNPSDEEAKAPGIIPVYIEKRFYKELDGFIIDGEADFIGQGVLEDFKSTGVYGYMKGNNDEKYIQQGSIYRWLTPEVITEDFMRIQHIFTDWSKLDAMIKKKAGYPQSRIITKKLELMPIEETEVFIKGRLRLIKAHLKSDEKDLPQCTPEELWQDKTVYKYFSKPANTRAQKVCDTYAEAHEYFMKGGAKGLIKEVHGKVKRCAYCDGFDLCTQKDEYIANGSFVPNR